MKKIIALALLVILGGIVGWYVWSHDPLHKTNISQSRYTRLRMEEKVSAIASSSSAVGNSTSVSNPDSLEALIMKAKNFLSEQSIYPQKVVDYQEKTWPDACLGIYGEGDVYGKGVCAPITIRGYEIWFADSPEYYINVNISNDGKIIGTGGDVPVKYFDTTGPHLKLRQ